ncbi:MAG: TolC family protein [Bdellovibrionota bacterium]
MRALARAAETEGTLSSWNFAPDFKLMYQQRIAGAPDNSHILGVSMSIPLWFWGNSSEVRAASARESAARKELLNSEAQVGADIRTLKYALASSYELYEIFRE